MFENFFYLRRMLNLAGILENSTCKRIALRVENFFLLRENSEPNRDPTSFQHIANSKDT